MSSSEIKNCASCSKENASQVCAGCNGAPNPTSTGLVKTLYCDANCQKAHWDEHKLTCKAHKARKILFRAGETAQMAFYAFRENTFDLLINRIEKNGNDLVIHESLYGKTEECYFPFPHRLLPDERDKQAVLTYLTCGDAVGYMHEMFKVMLDGICSKITELSISTKPYQRIVTLIRGDGSFETRSARHEIIQVLLKSREMYVLDIAGAQHGCYNPVYPWDQYIDSRVLAVTEAQSFGATQTSLLSDGTCLRLTPLGMVRNMHRGFLVCFYTTVNEWQKENLKLGEMLKLPEEKFHKKRGELISEIRRDLRDFKRWMKETGRRRPVSLTGGVLKQ